MFDYLQQFNSLPKDLRDRVSSPSVMTAVTELETKYKVDLAMTVMKVMIKSLNLKNLTSYFISEAGLPSLTAENLTRELKEKVFVSVSDYLGLASEIRAFDLDKDIEVLIKEAGIALASGNLVLRFKNIISTYLRGVRGKIDTKNSLSKDVKIGGLNLSSAEIDRVLKICDSGKFKSTGVLNVSPVSNQPTKPISRPTEEYDLKKALASGQTKPLATSKSDNKLDTKHELSAPVIPKELVPPIGDAKSVESIKPSGTVKPAETIKLEETKRSAAPIVRPTPTITRPVASRLTAITHPAAPIRPTTTAIPTIQPTPRPAASRPAPTPAASRPQMHDIKSIPKVMGPIEELQFLDLVNFRRLGKTPAETTAKIFTKIKLLEKEGYDKMVAGVRAWRQSPVSRLYLRLGQEAIAKGILLKDAVNARQTANQEYLSLEEIEAIVNLNSKLLF